MAWIKNRMIAAGEIGTSKLTVEPVVPVLTVGAESSNARDVVVQLKNPDGTNVSRSVALKCEVLDADGLLGLVAAFRLSEVGAGTAVSTSAKPTLLVTTDANGAATIRVTDQTAALVGTCYLLVTPVGTFGSPAYAAVTFA